LCTSVIPALRRGRQKAHRFKTSLGYIAIPCLKKEKKSKTEQNKNKRNR
jgi:hypothetical protein